MSYYKYEGFDKKLKSDLYKLYSKNDPNLKIKNQLLNENLDFIREKLNSIHIILDLYPHHSFENQAIINEIIECKNQVKLTNILITYRHKIRG